MKEFVMEYDIGDVVIFKIRHGSKLVGKIVRYVFGGGNIFVKLVTLGSKDLIEIREECILEVIYKVEG